MSLNIKEPYIVDQLSDGPVGKEYLFYNSNKDENEYFSYATDLSRIVGGHDVCIKNNTKVLVLSEPVLLNNKYGSISVTKVLAYCGIKSSKTFSFAQPWVLTEYLKEIKNEPISSHY